MYKNKIPEAKTIGRDQRICDCFLEMYFRNKPDAGIRMSLSFRFLFIFFSPFLHFYFFSHFLFTDSYCTYNMLTPNHYTANKPQLNTAGVEPCRAHSSHVRTHNLTKQEVKTLSRKYLYCIIRSE